MNMTRCHALTCGITVTLCAFTTLAFLFAVEFASSRRAAQHSRIRGALTYIALGIHNYTTEHGAAPFDNEEAQGWSWRVLIAPYYEGYESMGYNKIASQEMPIWLHEPWKIDIESDLTGFRSMRITSELEALGPANDAQSPPLQWVVIYAPSSKVEWRFQDAVSEADFRQLVEGSTSVDPVFLVTSNGLIAQASSQSLTLRSNPLRILHGELAGVRSPRDRFGDTPRSEANERVRGNAGGP